MNEFHPLDAATTHASAREIPVLGIIGGIGSGKSAIARWAGDHGHCHHIDADAIGHRVLNFPPIQEQLRKTFGEGIVDSLGQIDRRGLARLVFGSQANQQEQRLKLEQIVWPEIAREIEIEIQAARSSRLFAAILLDAAVLLEAGWSGRCDRIVFVEVPRSQQLQQVLQQRGWSAEELARREESQWSLADKRRHADVVLVNDQTLEHAGRALLEVVSSFSQDAREFPSE